MTYNSRSIRPHKGKLIKLTYKNKHRYQDEIIGEIIANTPLMIIFNVNKTQGKERLEISIKYADIVDISPPELAQEK